MRLNNSISIWVSVLCAMVAVYLPAGSAKGDATTQPSGSITVHVVGQDSKPVAGATVLLIKGGEFHHRDPASQPTDPPAGGHRTPPPSIAQGTTDDSGTFVFDNVPHGQYGVLAMLHHVGHGHMRVELSGDSATVTITLQPPHSQQ